jgi:hypothetical protein
MEAVEEVTAVTGKVPYLAHARSVIIGETTAQKGIRDIVDFLTHYPECRYDVNLYISMGIAGEYVKEAAESKLIEQASDYLQMGAKNTRLASATVLETSKRLLTIGTDPFIPAISLLDGTLAISGTAVFLEDKLTVFLSREATQGLLLLRGADTTDIVSIGNDLSARIAFKLEKAKAKIILEFSGNSIQWEVSLKIEAAVYEIGSGVNDKSESSLVPKLEEEVTRLIKCYFKETQTAEGDPVGFGRIVRRRDMTAYKKGAWKPVLEKNIAIKVQASISNAESIF